MEVPLLRFIREFEGHLKFLQGTYPAFGMYLQMTFPKEDVSLTFDNKKT
jgi:hypothetical protein